MTPDWIDTWIGAVAQGKATMSQRALGAIERNGGLEAAVAAARARGVHLLSLTDETGREIVAASRHPFHTLC